MANDERDADFSELDKEFAKQEASQKQGMSASFDSQDGAGEIDRLRAEILEMKDKHLRLLAEFDNFKKRAQKERSDTLKYQGEVIFTDLLDVIDTFELSRQYTDSDVEKYKAGVDLIYKKFLDFLAKWEVRGESSIGKEFNPSVHTAISRMPVSGGEDGSPSAGQVVGELKKPYYYKDRLLRPGEVVVAVAAEGAEITQ